MNRQALKFPTIRYSPSRHGDKVKAAQKRSPIHSLVSAESQVGGVVHSCWGGGLMDGSPGKVQKISRLWREKPTHSYGEHRTLFSKATTYFYMICA